MYQPSHRLLLLEYFSLSSDVSHLASLRSIVYIQINQDSLLDKCARKCALPPSSSDLNVMDYSAQVFLERKGSRISTKFGSPEGLSDDSMGEVSTACCFARPRFSGHGRVRWWTL